MSDDVWTAHGWCPTIQEFDDCSCPVRLAGDTDDTTMIEFLVEGYMVRFNAQWIPEEQLAWFAQVLSRQLVELSTHAEQKTRGEISAAYTAFMLAMEFRQAKR